MVSLALCLESTAEVLWSASISGGQLLGQNLQMRRKILAVYRMQFYGRNNLTFQKCFCFQQQTCFCFYEHMGKNPKSLFTLPVVSADVHHRASLPEKLRKKRVSRWKGGGRFSHLDVVQDELMSGSGARQLAIRDGLPQCLLGNQGVQVQNGGQAAVETDELFFVGAEVN